MIRKLRRARPGACILTETFGVQDLTANYLWEMSQFMLALYDAPDEVKAFQQRFADWAVTCAVNGVRAGADVVLIYDDYGYTDHLLLSMKMWREFTLPHLKRIIAAVHEAGAVAMLHSCGYQMPLLASYVEAELDILQAFQPKAGNDFAAAYAQYGDRLTFCTGIDTQLGESMTPQELRADILRYYQIGRTKNRFILGMTHMLQYTLSNASLCTLLETVHKVILNS